jgi:chromate transporter
MRPFATSPAMPLESDPLLPPAPSDERPPFRSFLASIAVLGALAFGGPTAHIALLHDKYVAGPPRPPAPRVSESMFIELFALTSALPGPSTTKLATAIGATFGGLTGAVLTFTMWQLPGSLLMTGAGLWFHARTATGAAGGVDAAAASDLANYFIGLVSAAFAMVVIAAMKITNKTCATSRVKTAVCVVTATVAVLVPPENASSLFVALLVAGGCVVLCDHHRTATMPGPSTPSNLRADYDDVEEWNSRISEHAGAALLALFVLISAALFVWRPTSLDGRILRTFWKVGTTGFGGGTVVIPLILTECAAFLPPQLFLFGLGLISLAPGPMFNLAWFLGAALLGLRGAFLAAFGLFAPGMILLLGVLPFWERIRRWKAFRVFLTGVNAAATGLIVAGVWMLLCRTLLGPLAFALAVIAAAGSLSFGVPTPLVILGCGAMGALAVALDIGGPYMQ